jgi:predicted TIM-barrel fold metal-dependent hydrolase
MIEANSAIGSINTPFPEIDWRETHPAPWSLFMAIFDLHSYLGGALVPNTANNGASIASIMQARGVTSAVVMSAHARLVDPLAGNRVLAKVIEQSPALYGCVVTHVNRVDASVAAMRELMQNRRILGMCVTGLGNEAVVDKIVAEDIINAYRRYGKPLFLYANNAAMTHAALEIAKTYTMLKVVLLGMGGHDWRVAIAAAHAATNIYLETSGPLDRSKIPAAFETLGAHRILFGSGTPHVDAGAAMGLLEDTNLSSDVRRRILSDNAMRLFSLEEE